MLRRRVSRIFICVVAVGMLLTALTVPVVADPGSPSTQDSISVWIARVRAEVERHRSQVPPEWRQVLEKAREKIRDGWGGADVPSCPRGRSLSAASLDRIEIGYQAGILKIVSRDGRRVLYVDDRPGSVMVAVDSVEYAPLSDDHRYRIFSALGIQPGELDDVANGLMHDYASLPRTKVLALLGVLGSTPEGNGGHISSVVDRRIRRFLASRLRAESDVKIHRMAVLSLALCADISERTVDAVLNFMGSTQNSWETFTTQQFFQYHHEAICQMHMAGRVRERLESCDNPYGPSIAATF